jgi:hypothetical protein
MPDYSTYHCLRVQLDRGIARVTLDNGAINLLDKPLFKELLRLTDDLAADDAVRVVLLCSANPQFFIAHFDVGLILRFPADAPAADAPPAPLSPFHRMAEAWRTMPKATIAVVEGRAGGGGSEIALSCDMRFALRGGAIFNQPEVALGILPGGSGTVRLGRLLGRSRALEAVLGCDDRHRRRHGRALGLGQPHAGRGCAVAACRPPGGAHRQLSAACGGGGQGQRAARRAGRRGRSAGRGAGLPGHAGRGRHPGGDAALRRRCRPDAGRRDAPGRVVRRAACAVVRHGLIQHKGAGRQPLRRDRGCAELHAAPGPRHLVGRLCIAMKCRIRLSFLLF